MSDMAPRVVTLEQYVQPVATAGNDLWSVIGVVPFDGTITAVTYVPLADITGAATNNRTLKLVNKALDGNGAVVPATLSFGNGTNASDYDETTITLSSTASDLTVLQDQVLAWQSLHVGTGIADPGGLVRVTISRS